MRSSLYRKLGYMLAMGTEVGVLVGGGAALGVELDERFGTTPVIFLIALFLGIATASWRTYVYVRLLTKDDEQ